MQEHHLKFESKRRTVRRDLGTSWQYMSCAIAKQIKIDSEVELCKVLRIRGTDTTAENHFPRWVHFKIFKLPLGALCLCIQDPAAPTLIIHFEDVAVWLSRNHARGRKGDFRALRKRKPPHFLQVKRRLVAGPPGLGWLHELATADSWPLDSVIPLRVSRRDFPAARGIRRKCRLRA